MNHVVIAVKILKKKYFELNFTTVPVGRPCS